MSLLHASMKMADVIHSNYMLIPVINRLGIHLGFGEKTVKTVCLEHNLDVDFVLCILNTYSNEEYFPKTLLRTFNVRDIIKYLRCTHRYYLQVQIPIIEELIERLVSKYQSKDGNLALVQAFFQTYKRDLTEHLRQEEHFTYPYIEQIYELSKTEFDADAYRQLMHSYSMKRYSEEHSDIDDKLFDLQNILIKYITMPEGESITNSIVFELFRLERDIKDHTRLEDKILRPLVLELEQALKNFA